MEYTKKLKTNIKKNMQKLVNVKTIFLLCFFWRAIPILFMKSINISTDEFTVIGMAAHLAGLDWTASIRSQYYYGYPMSFIYAPLFFIKPLLEYPILLYRLCLFINALLGMLNTWITYKLLLKLCDNSQVLWLTLIFSLSPSSIALEKALTNDTLLSVCFNLAIYICISFVNNDKRKNILNSLLLGGISLLAYVINGRGIILLGMIIILWLIMRIFHDNFFLHIGVYILSIAGLFFVHSRVKAYYIDTFFSSENIQVANSGFGSYIEILERFLSVNGGIALLIATIGILYALTFSSYGFNIILLFVMVGIFISKMMKKQKYNPIFEKPCKNETYILILLCSIFILLSIGITILHFGNFYNDMSLKLQGEEIQNIRVDKMFYSRYTATIKPLLIILGLYLIDKMNKQCKKRLMAISFVFIVLLCILFQVLNAQLIDNASYAASNSPELSIILGNTDVDYKFGVVIAKRFTLASTAIITLIGFYYVGFLMDKMNIFYICFTSINIALGIILLTRFLIPRSEYYYNIPDQNIIEYINDIYSETPDIAFITNGTEDYLYQVQLPKVKIANLNSGSIDDYNELIIVNYEQKDLDTAKGILYEVELECSKAKNILIKGCKTIEYFKSKNFLMNVYHEER